MLNPNGLMAGPVKSINQGNMNVTSGVPRDWFSANFGGADEIALEDWQRSELSQNNQLQRDLYFQEQANKFNAQEAQKQRDYDKAMRDTQYLSAIEQFKQSGINPVMAVQHGASYSGGTSASSSGGRSSNYGIGKGYTADGIGQLLGAALSIGAGLLTKGIINGKKFKVGF